MAKATAAAETGIMANDATADGCFSASYLQARNTFLAAAADAGAEISQYRFPRTGPGGEPLAVDVAEIGAADADRVLVVCSGTHGVEGFAGSAIQIALLREHARDLGADTPRLVLIHALNPYGFAWLRRFTEDNIDLNRNFTEAGTAPPDNPAYDSLHSVLCPRRLSPWSDLLALARLLLFAARHGIAATRTVVTVGQYSHPDGLFFGGREPSWSARTLRQILSHHVASAADVVFIDVHTGLGRFGHAEIILNSPTGTPEYHRARAIWGDQVRTTRNGEAVSADLTGTLKLAVQHQLAPARVTAVSIEFGTYSALNVLRAVRAENWLSHHGDPGSQQGRRIKQRLREVFAPDSEIWRAQVLENGSAAAARALAWLADLPKGPAPT